MRCKTSPVQSWCSTCFAVRTPTRCSTQATRVRQSLVVLASGSQTCSVCSSTTNKSITKTQLECPRSISSLSTTERTAVSWTWQIAWLTCCKSSSRCTSISCGVSSLFSPVPSPFCSTHAMTLISPSFSLLSPRTLLLNLEHIKPSSSVIVTRLPNCRLSCASQTR